MALPEDAPTKARACCPRCDKPVVVCYCAHLHQVATLTRILLLQHPREEQMKVGTARMAHLSLPNSVLRIGLDFSDDAVVKAELADARPTYVLFPTPDALDIRVLRGVPSVRLIVLDGTWRQARKLLKLNPWLQRLPAVAFTPTHPSEYQIRKQPAEHCVSTIEALGEALRLIEPDGLPVDGLLEPFRAMVEQQQWYQVQVGHRRSRHHRQPSRRKPPFARLIQDYSRIVCVQGEANAWALRDPQRHEPSIVHWVAHRPASGESYEAIVAPSGPLAPLTSRHIGLSEAQLLAGLSPEAWKRSWQAFLRPDDVLLHWGHHYHNVAQQDGLSLPDDTVDLRSLSAADLRRRSGTTEALLERVAPGSPVADLGFQGRAGQRLANLVALVKVLVSSPLQRVGN